MNDLAGMPLSFYSENGDEVRGIDQGFVLIPLVAIEISLVSTPCKPSRLMRCAQPNPDLSETMKSVRARLSGVKNMNTSSVFELSPSEKLQLVEDLWDDLAADAESVPVHAWQKQELARRKANLIKNPASARPRDEVKRRVRAGHGL
jgi:putative addiction module component (TIGR02574 family)